MECLIMNEDTIVVLTGNKEKDVSDCDINSFLVGKGFPGYEYINCIPNRRKEIIIRFYKVPTTIDWEKKKQGYEFE